MERNHCQKCQITVFRSFMIKDNDLEESQIKNVAGHGVFFAKSCEFIQIKSG